jgi:hypothetical protein
MLIEKLARFPALSLYSSIVPGLSFNAVFDVICCIFSDEQERVQKKTFTNWMNTYLKQVSKNNFVGVL